MEDKSKNVPKLRFPGFTDAWEQCKLGEVANRFDNFRVPITANLRISGETPYYGANGIQDYVEGFTHDGEFILVAEDGANDLVNYPITYVKGCIWVNNHAHVLQGKNKSVNNKFLAFAIGRSNIQMFLVGGSRAKLNAEALMKIEVFLPSIPEQELISKCLVQLDNLITLHQRKLDNLKNKKKCLLQKMFPKNGESFPEIRFPEFTDAWEQRKLGEIAEISSGGTPSTSNTEYWDGDINWYSPVEIGEQIYVTESQKKITELGLQKSSAKILPIGTVLFTSRAGIGKTAILARKGATNQGFQSILPHDNELDTYFIFSRTEELKAYGEINGAGSTFVEVSGKQMAKMPIMLPHLNEQKKVGLFFKQLDNLITLHQRKLDHLKERKKALLGQMFV